jgi:hypothetical protein
MTIAKVKTSGWSTNEKLTAAQITAIDTNVTNALDKRTGQSDTVLSTLTLSSPGTITVSSSGQIKANTASAIQVNAVDGIKGNTAFGISAGVSQGIYSGVANGIYTATASGIVSAVAGGITATTVAGITPGVSQGISSGISGGIYSSVNGGVMGVAAGSIMSLTTGGLALAGGANDWPTFNGSTRSKTRVSRAISHVVSPRTNWDFSFGDYIQSTALNAYCFVHFDVPHNGATLTSIKLYFTTPTAWTVAPSAGTASDWPGLQLYRTTIATNATVSLNSGSAYSYYPAESLATLNNGSVKVLTFTCNQNNVIDSSLYTYGGNLFSFSNSGTSSQPYLNAWTFEENYTAIANMQFP